MAGAGCALPRNNKNKNRPCGVTLHGQSTRLNVVAPTKATISSSSNNNKIQNVLFAPNNPSLEGETGVPRQSPSKNPFAIPNFFAALPSKPPPLLLLLPPSKLASQGPIPLVQPNQRTFVTRS